MTDDEFFHILSSSCRREILRLLQDGELSAGEITGHFPVSQPSISRHLDLLKRGGLIASRRQANQIFYSLTPHAVQDASRRLKNLFPGKDFLS